MTNSEPRPPRHHYTLPRWLAALSIAVGLGLPAIVVIQTGGLAGASEQQMAFAMIMTIVLHVGYILAPFLIGRGQWRSFFAGLVLAPSLAGWISMFVPGIAGHPLVAVLGAVSAVALIGDYIYIFRHFAAEFLSNRKSGGPG